MNNLLLLIMSKRGRAEVVERIHPVKQANPLIVVLIVVVGVLLVFGLYGKGVKQQQGSEEGITGRLGARIDAGVVGGR